MEEVDNPRQLFRGVDATSLEENNFRIENHINGLSVEVEFSETESDATAQKMALTELRENIPSAKDADGLPEGADTILRDDDWTFLVDSKRLGYEIIHSENPERLAFAVIDPGAGVKVR